MGRSERPGRTHPSHRAGDGRRRGRWRRVAGSRPIGFVRISPMRRRRAAQWETPAKPAIEKPAIEKAGRRTTCCRQAGHCSGRTRPRRPLPRRNRGKTQICLDGHPHLAGARRGKLRLILSPGRPLLRLDRRRLCGAPNNTMLGARVGGPHLGDPGPATIPWSGTGDVVFRIDEGRLSYRGRRRPAPRSPPQQATIDRIGPSGHRAGKRGRAGPRRKSSRRKPALKTGRPRLSIVSKR